MKNTRITASSSTRIDLIFTNVSYILQSGTIATGMSDHEAVYLIKKKIWCNIKYEYINGGVIKIISKRIFKLVLGMTLIGLVTIPLMMSMSNGIFLKIL